MGQDLPRVYRLKRSARVILVLGLLLSVAMAAFFFFVGFDTGGNESGKRWTCITIGLLCAWYAVHAVLSLQRTRLVLEHDAIDIRNVYRSRRMARADIAGFRTHPGQTRLPVIRLLTREPGSRGILLPDLLDTDAAFYEWFEGLDWLDAKEQQASLEEFLATPELLGTPEGKLAALQGANRVAQWLAWLSIAIALWLVAFPRPYWLVVSISAMLPWIAIGLAAIRGELYKLDRHDNEVGAHLFGPMYVPGMALALRAFLDVDVLDQQQLFWLSLAGVAVLLCIVYGLVTRFRPSVATVVSVGFLMWAYVFGVLTFANTRFDLGPPELNGARDRECVYLWPGALGVRWYQAGECPKE